MKNIHWLIDKGENYEYNKEVENKLFCIYDVLVYCCMRFREKK